MKPQQSWRSTTALDGPDLGEQTTSVFSKIIDGDLPARFVWHDSKTVAFLSTAPIAPGHTLVVPRRQFDQWTDADRGALTRCATVAHHIGRAVQLAWDAPRAGLIIAGFEVAHFHMHVFPAWHLQNFTFGGADQNPSPETLDESAHRIRGALRQIGHRCTVPTR